jgi:hypothetical protein
VTVADKHVRADFLLPADAARVRTLLKSYLDRRVLFYETRENRKLKQIEAASNQLETTCGRLFRRRPRLSRHHFFPLLSRG